MPTKLPRLSITLPPDLEDALSGFAAACGQSRSSVVVELLSQAQKHMEQAAAMHRRITSLKPQALEALRARAEELDRLALSDATAAQRLIDDVVGQASLLLPDAPDTASECSERPIPVRPGASFDPPPVNKGGENLNRPSRNVTSILRKRG